MAGLYKVEDRLGMIDEILRDIDDQKYKTNGKSVRHLQVFFKAAKSPLSYLRWLLFVSPFLKKNELLELTDLGNQKWNDQFYPLMAETERMKFPGLVEPVVREVTRQIVNSNLQHVLQLGSGPMEIERQIVTNLKTQNRAIRFYGIDLSPYAQAYAKRLLLKHGIEVEEVSSVVKLQDLLDLQPNKTSVVLYCGDAIDLLGQLSFNEKSLIFHSLFRHHLTDSDKHKLDLILQRVKCAVVEYDGYRAMIPRIFTSIGTWMNPLFLNSSVFSNCRYDSKKEIRVRNKNVKFIFPPGSYVSSKF